MKGFVNMKFRNLFKSLKFKIGVALSSLALAIGVAVGVSSNTNTYALNTNPRSDSFCYLELVSIYA